jgi:hypothetical protein
MLSVKEAAAQLTLNGIAASDQEVMTWIKEGKIKAKMDKRRNTTYKIHIKDLIAFMIQTHTAHLTSQLEEFLQENRRLTEQIELLKTRVHIEQSKVRTLKKCLNTQIQLNGSCTMNYSELLGVNQDSNSHDLKKEFKKLLKALHPDRGGDERLFKVFHEHYENIK